jgi:hypothetical protein
LKEEHCLALLDIINEIPSLQYIRLRSIWNLPSSLATCKLLPQIVVDNAKVLQRTNLSCATVSNLAIKDFSFYMNSRLVVLGFYDLLFRNEISIVRLSVSAADLPTIPFERLCLRGLERIQIFVDLKHRINLDWFPEFTRRHALLDEIIFSMRKGPGWEKLPDIPHVNRLLGMFSEPATHTRGLSVFDMSLCARPQAAHGVTWEQDLQSFFQPNTGRWHSRGLTISVKSDFLSSLTTARSVFSHITELAICIGWIHEPLDAVSLTPL